MLRLAGRNEKPRRGLPWRGEKTAWPSAWSGELKREPLVGVVPVTHGPAQILDGLLELVLQFSHLLPGGVQFLAKRLHVVLLGLLPCLMRGVKFLLRLRKQFLRLLTNGLFVILETQGHAALLLADLRHRDGFIRHTAQFGDEPEFFKCANRPLGGVKLPWLHAVAVVVLKLVVEVVVALAKVNSAINQLSRAEQRAE